MKKIALLLFIFAFSSLSAFPQVVNEILKRMNAHQKLLRSLEADITISKFSVQSDETFIKEGTVKFFPTKTDYLLRIDSTKPVPESFSIVNNQYIIYQPNPNPFYQPNTAFAYTGAVTDTQKNLLWIFSVLANYPRENWKRDFASIVYKGQENVNKQIPTWHLELKPKTADAYRKINIWVDGNGMPLQSTITENSGDRTTVLLGNLKKLQQIKSDDFQIKLPKGTKIIKD